MSSGREGYQKEEPPDVQAEPGLGEPERKLLEAIFGKAPPSSGIKSDEGSPWKKGLDSVVLATLLTNAGLPLFAACGAAVGVQRWMLNHAPTAHIFDEIDYEEALRKTILDPGGFATLLTSAKLPAARATTELVQRWVQDHVPTTQIEEISILASAVIGDRDKATKWLSESNPGTDNRRPIDLIGEKDGYDRVKNLLLRIEYGALA